MKKGDKRVKTEIIINVASQDSRIAILEDGKLVEILVEFDEKERMVGNVYKGKVSAVLPGMQASFVDIGGEKSAFLHASDMPGSPGSMVDLDDETLEEVDYKTNSRGKTIVPIEELIREGQDLLVQVKKEPIGTKGPRVTAVPSLAGRFMVLVPNGEKVGVSRKITDWSEKRRLKDIGREIKPEGYGIIVRTEASGKGDRELSRDMKDLVGTWERIQKQAKKLGEPRLIHKEMGMTSSLIRDLFTDDVQRLVVDSKREYKQIISYLKTTSPHLRERVECHRDKTPVFDAFGIEEEIEKCYERKVWLKGGGYLVLDHTEALVSIDVNSGRYVGRTNQEETVLKINLEAANEIARQLRLRDIGGIIVIDFIDMMYPQNRRKVEEEFRLAIRRDRSRPRTSEISEFGLMEMTRQRVRPSLLFTFSESCPTCKGTGRVASRETTLARIERWLNRSRAASVERRLTVHVNPAVGEFLLENRKERLKRVRRSTRVWLNVEMDLNLPVDAYRIYSRKRNADITDKFKT
ncbi:MAG: Rne/Rng family ribonuclease [bacterium]|nr:Rne/Rng family ribonuclease [bacterium]